jgi:hypothetical protein
VGEDHLNKLGTAVQFGCEQKSTTYGIIVISNIQIQNRSHTL